MSVVFESFFIFLFAGFTEVLRASKHGYSVMRCFFSIMDIPYVLIVKPSFQPHTAVHYLTSAAN